MTNEQATDTARAWNQEKSTRFFDASPFSFALFWLFFLVALKLVAPFVPVTSRLAAIGVNALFTIWYVVGVVMFAAQMLRVRLALWQRVTFLIGALALWFFLSNLLPTRGAPVSSTRLEILQALVDLSLMLSAILGGSVVAQMISAPNLLGPLCGLLAMLDVWFVLFQGIASQMIASAPAYAAKVTASAPAVGAASSQFHVSPVGIGVADYLFLGFFFAVMHRFGMNWRASAKWTMVLISGALLAVMLGVGALPGLLFIGLGAAIPNWKFFEYSKEEKLALMQAGGFVVLLTTALRFAQPYIIAHMKTVK